MLGDHCTHQQPAITAALRTELLHSGDAAVHQIGCHRSEVLGNQVTARAHRLGVPAGAVLAAAADVGQHKGAAAR